MLTAAWGEPDVIAAQAPQPKWQHMLSSIQFNYMNGCMLISLSDSYVATA